MSKEERKATAIKGGRLIDGTGAQPIENAIDIHMFPIEWVKERKVFSINSLICDGVDECHRASRQAL